MKKSSIKYEKIFALGDQFSYVGANLILGLMILAQNDFQVYGHYAFIISCLAIPFSIFSSVVLDSIVVYGGVARLSRIGYAILGLYIKLIIVLLVVLVILFVFLDSGIEYLSFYVYFAGQTIILLRKKLQYMFGRVKDAFRLSITHFMITVAFASLFAMYDSVTITLIFYLVFFSSLTLNIGFIGRVFKGKANLRHLRYLHRIKNYSKWMFWTNLPSTIAMQVHYWLGYYLLGAQLIGIFKLLEQLVYPFTQILIALNGLEYIKIRRIVVGRHVDLHSHLNRLRVIYGVYSVVYSVLLLLILQFLYYSHEIIDKVLENKASLILFLLVLPIQSIAMIEIMKNKACENAKAVFASYFAMACFVAITCIVLSDYGINSLIAAIVIGWFISYVANRRPILING